MRRIGLALIGVWVLAMACMASSAQLGARFAEAYDAFSPLARLYSSYRDHLFLGTPVAIPDGIDVACERFSYELAVFHVEYVNQTGSGTTADLRHLIRLRVETAAFCEAFGGWLGVLAESGETDPEIVGAAGEEGLFSEIKRVNDLIAETLDEILAGLGDGFDRWSFGVTFSVRALLLQSEIERLDANTREILYGDPEGAAPPFDVPADVSDAMARLVELSDRELTADEIDAAFDAATRIYESFVPIGPPPE